MLFRELPAGARQYGNPENSPVGRSFFQVSKQRFPNSPWSSSAEVRIDDRLCRLPPPGRLRDGLAGRAARPGAGIACSSKQKRDFPLQKQ